MSEFVPVGEAPVTEDNSFVPVAEAPVADNNSEFTPVAEAPVADNNSEFTPVAEAPDYLPFPTERNPITENPFKKPTKPQTTLTGAEALFPDNNRESDISKGIVRKLPKNESKPPKSTDPWTQPEAIGDILAAPKEARETAPEKVQPGPLATAALFPLALTSEAYKSGLNTLAGIAQAPILAAHAIDQVTTDINNFGNRRQGLPEEKNLINEKYLYEHNPVALALKSAASNMDVQKDYFTDNKSALDYMKDKNAKKAGEKLAFELANVVPIVVATIATGGTGVAAAIGAGTAGERGEQLTEKEDVNTTDTQKNLHIADAIGNGMIDAMFQSIGEMKIIKNLHAAYLVRAAQDGEEVAKKSATQAITSLMGSVGKNVLTNTIGAGLVPVVSKGILDKVTGARPDLTAKDVKDEFLNMLPSSLAFSGLSGIATDRMGNLVDAKDAVMSDVQNTKDKFVDWIGQKFPKKETVEPQPGTETTTIKGAEDLIPNQTHVPKQKSLEEINNLNATHAHELTQAASGDKNVTLENKITPEFEQKYLDNRLEEHGETIEEYKHRIYCS